jgi:serine phosphatase RsbU (regulator of sigma subunit)
MAARSRVTEFVDTYTRDLKAEDIQRLFTRDTRDAYRFFTRQLDPAALAGLPRRRRIALRIRQFFMAFTMKLSPARRLVFAVAVATFAIGMLDLWGERAVVRRGEDTIIVGQTGFADGTGWLLVAFGLVNLLVVLEVADRLSLKNDLEVAREIQEAMLPKSLYVAAGVEAAGLSRPANTVGGDFYEVLPLDDGRLVIAVGDVAGKGSPAALLMALSLAMLRTLVDLAQEWAYEPADIVARLNRQVARQAPGSRFITLFYGLYQPLTGELQYVNAGHTQPLLVRAAGPTERLTAGGVALGMFDRASYESGRVVLQKGDLLSIYSDGITEAENAAGQAFEESGLEAALAAVRDVPVAAIGSHVVEAVERHTGDTRFADDLTILVLRRTAPAGAA